MRVIANKDICIVNNGYYWMQYFPHNGSYALTATFDDEGQIVQWYFDIVKQNGISVEDTKAVGNR